MNLSTEKTIHTHNTWSVNKCHTIKDRSKSRIHLDIGTSWRSGAQYDSVNDTLPKIQHILLSVWILEAL